MTYQIIEIKPSDFPEQLGTKEKYWTDNQQKLFKIGRDKTGENWAEKVAYELTKLLGIASASYQFATCDGTQGILSNNFISQGDTLLHGNEVLHHFDSKYDTEQTYRQKQYRLEIVLRRIKSLSTRITLPTNCQAKDALTCFIGYLVFDAWIGNQDRHHENWGLIIRRETNDIQLAPSYDHASSLACRLSDTERQKRLLTKDKGYDIKAYANRAKTPFYDNSGKILTSYEVVSFLLLNYSKETNYWLNKLKTIDNKRILEVFNKIPSTIISKTAIEFSMMYLETNKNKLINLQVNAND